MRWHGLDDAVVIVFFQVVKTGHPLDVSMSHRPCHLARQRCNPVVAEDADPFSATNVFQGSKGSGYRFQVCAERTEEIGRKLYQCLVWYCNVFCKSAIAFLAAHHVAFVAEDHGVGADHIAYMPSFHFVITIDEPCYPAAKFMAHDNVGFCWDISFGYSDICSAYSGEMHFDKHVETTGQSRHFPVSLIVNT